MLLHNQNTESLSPPLPTHSFPKLEHSLVQTPDSPKGESVAGSDSALGHASQNKEHGDRHGDRNTAAHRWGPQLLFPFKALTFRALTPKIDCF